MARLPLKSAWQKVPSGAYATSSPWHGFNALMLPSQSARLLLNPFPIPPQIVTLSSQRTTTYYYYPKRSHTLDDLTPQYQYITITRAPTRPQTPPPLSYSNTSTPITRSPSTPVEKMAKGPTTQRVVNFAKEVTARRPLRDDEYSVMDRFARHASKCKACADPYASWKQDISLCDRGWSYARDVARYTYSKGGRPLSIIDRLNGDYVQLDIPPECEVINSLIKAWDHGLCLNKTKRPIIVTPQTPKRDAVEAPRIVSTPKDYVFEDSRRDRRSRNYDVVEIIPNSSRRDRRERTYRDDRGEERYRSERRERPVSYHESKGSLYERDEEEKRRRQRYDEQPIVIIAEPTRRYTRR
ncbi:hypothetical protein LTR96_008626 [Exophiala xenobiotica]|nr:hypothetical protein LTR92_001054 [Exophiala xenobiotica]KAK5539365.1 hypothetical protein LTR23_006586 [Chaetothyriales sp. CCFEE 6169]KAK5266231.1 hypothetical protein LTR96_008626 [Exophiala xenobiotica]KAK5337872.1 hypothetical protein LTR98_005721 [Exophiala xenobiotica]KAK5363499.1 hypothetical protein LTS13_009133 [Exophiala xenobiotica]